MIYNFKNDTLFFNRYLVFFKPQNLLKISCHCEWSATE